MAKDSEQIHEIDLSSSSQAGTSPEAEMALKRAAALRAAFNVRVDKSNARLMQISSVRLHDAPVIEEFVD